MQLLQPKWNWVDLSIDTIFAANGVGVPFVYSALLNGVSAGGLAPGRCVGRSYTVERIELRALLIMFDAALLAANAREMQAGGTPMTIPAGSWAGGNGPALPIAFTTTSVELPAKLYWGGLRPFRVLVIYDANPTKTGASISLDRIIDTTTDAISDSAAVMPFLLQNADQYAIVHDEVVNPKDSTGEFLYEATIDVRRFWLEKARMQPPASVLNATGSALATALSSGGYWLMLLTTGGQSFNYYPGIYRGSSRVYYLDDA